MCICHQTPCHSLLRDAHSPIPLMASPSISPPPQAEEDPATHTSRNPTQPQQQTRVLTYLSLSLAQKATRSLRLLSDHAKAEKLAVALDILLARHQTELEDFSKEHNTKLEYIQKLTSQSRKEGPSQFKMRRCMQNHWRSMEVHAIQSLSLIYSYLFRKTLASGKESS